MANPPFRVLFPCAILKAGRASRWVRCWDYNVGSASRSISCVGSGIARTPPGAGGRIDGDTPRFLRQYRTAENGVQCERPNKGSAVYGPA